MTAVYPYRPKVCACRATVKKGDDDCRVNPAGGDSSAARQAGTVVTRHTLKIGKLVAVHAHRNITPHFNPLNSVQRTLKRGQCHFEGRAGTATHTKHWENRGHIYGVHLQIGRGARRANAKFSG